MIERFGSRTNVPLSLTEKDMEYLWDAIDRVIADARRALLSGDLAGELSIDVRRRSNLVRPSYTVELTCLVDRSDR